MQKNLFNLNAVSKAVLLLALPVLSGFSMADPGDKIEITQEGVDVNQKVGIYDSVTGKGLVKEKLTGKQEAHYLNVGGNKSPDSILTVTGNTELDLTVHDMQSTSVTTLVEVSHFRNLELKGDVSLITVHKGANQKHEGGANGLYVWANATASVGTSGSSTYIASLAEKPDAISAKAAASIFIESTNNKIIGSMDFLGVSNVSFNSVSADDIGQFFFDDNANNDVHKYIGEVVGVGSLISATFAGKNSFWYGDEQHGKNSYLSASFTSRIEKFKETMEGMSQVFEVRYQDIVKNSEDSLILTFKDGAEWSYLGIVDYRNIPIKERTVKVFNMVVPISGNIQIRTIPKRISRIELENGGAVNLFDEDLRKRLDRIGFTKEMWSAMPSVTHNYVRIGDLRGNGGVFRLDLNSSNKEESDMIFIESSTKGGTHLIEPYNIENLQEISDTNHLRFATVSANSGITFTDKINYYESELSRFKLYIGSEKYNPDDPENKYYEDRVYEDAKSKASPQALAANEEVSNEAELNPGETVGFNPEKDFEDGENWFIYRIKRIEPPSVKFGLATWLYGTQLDRLNKRIGEIHYQENDSGLWVRGRFNRTGDSGLDLKWGGVQLGYDYKTSENNRVGAAFEYTNGRGKFDDYSGRDRMHGFNVMLYDTWVNNKGCYLDLTARWGKAHSSVWYQGFDQNRISGTYRQSILALSAEGGKKFFLSEEKKLFIEPQIQFQWARVGSASWTYSNNVKSKIDSANSYIGRVGARFGKEWTYEDGRRNNVYLKADLLHEFGKEQTGMLSDMKYSVHQKWGGKKTWGDVGISTQLSLGKQTWFHLDLEKELGRGMGRSWQINGNIRYTF